MHVYGRITGKLTPLRTITGTLTIPAVPPGYIKPTGDIELTDVGTFSVYQYATATVNITDGNELAYGISSDKIGTATIGTGYVWTDYPGTNIAIIGQGLVGTDAVV